ncbi:hypothetical protein Tco_0326903 [Tanacetum coccineum]
MSMDDLLQAVPKWISRMDSLETDLKQTKLTMGNAIVKLVKKVKKLEGFLKRRNMVLSDSEEEEPEAQGRKSQDDPLDSSVQGLVTPSTTKVKASGEEQVEDISPNTLEAAKTLSKVASLKPRSIDKGRRYKRRKEAKGKKVVSSLDFQEEVDTGAEQVNTAEGVSTGSTKLSTGSEQVSTVGDKKSTSSPDKGQRAGKAPMIIEETPKKSKEQVLQEEASLAEAIRLDTLQKEEVAKQVHLDSLLAQRIAEEEELNEQQKKRKAQVQFEAQHYTNEDWDLIRAKIEANAELSKSMLGSELQGEDFAKKMVDLVNQRKKYFAEERARAKRNKPMTQSQLKTYMMNYLKNQGTWKLSQLKNLSFEEVKKEFDKLVKQVESFAPINFEATKASLKRFGEELQTKTPKRLKDDEDVEAKDDEPTKKSGKRRKQMARKGLHTSVDKDDSEGSDEDSEQDDSVTGTKTPINPVPVAMKTPSIATYKIFKQGEKGAYQIVREDGTDVVYINFGAMLKVISRDDLTELYRIVMNRYGMDGPEDELEKVFWKYLKNMFEEPLSTDPIWSELGQQRIISWRYYESCRANRRRYKRRKETKGKKVVSSLDFQEEVDTGAEQVNTVEGVNTGSIKLSTISEQLSTGSEHVSTVSAKKSTPSPDKGQRAGKAPMIIEETPKKSKEQILQEEASLAEAIRLYTLQKEEVAKQVHLDSLLAQRITEEEELNEQQKKRKAQVQFEAQHYTDEDWDLIRAKIEANAELSKSMLGSDLQGEDFAKKMVDLGTWKLSQLNNLSFEEVKEKFDKLVKQVESFAPINFEATKASLKRFGEELQTKTSKRQKSDEAKDDKPTKKSGKRRKQWQKRRKKIKLHTDLDKDDSEDSDEVGEQEESVTGTKTPINPVPVAMKIPSIATYKIIKQGEKGVYQIVREDGTDVVYINFGAMLKDISRDDLTELYRIVMNRYGMDGPEDELEKVFWKYLKNMFEEPLSTDPIWSELGQQRIITMLDKKLQGGKPDENCYKMLKMMEKQAGIRK